MPGVKEITELVRMSAVVMAKAMVASKDGKFSRWDGAKLLVTSAGDIWDGIAGISSIPAEARDLDPDEAEKIIQEIIIVLEKSNKFTFRQRDIATLLLKMTYDNIIMIDRMMNLPPTAELVS